MLLLFAVAFAGGFILIGTYNYFVLYIIRVSGFLKTLDNKIAIAVLSILFLVIFIVRNNDSALALFFLHIFLHIFYSKRKRLMQNIQEILRFLPLSIQAYHFLH